MTLTRATDGTVNLHIWREGEEYLRQKGPTFLKEWNNIVFAARPGPALANTRYVDLSAAPIEFPGRTFDAVYSYHVFEHLTPSQGARCAGQIFNVLKPGGIFRISVPDLEMACVDYLDTLRAAVENPTPQNVVRYGWAVMAIFEQMVRDRTGGLMLERIDRGEYDDGQLRHMFGDMLRPLVERRGSVGSLAGRHHQRSSAARMVLRKIRRGARTILGKAPAGGSNRLDPRVTKEAVQWMYDRLSLRLLLDEAGFQDIQQLDHVSSNIPQWSRYDFDRSNNGGHPLDPSVYLEGRRPEMPGRVR
jgi:predicted SAM-dependent methyltransferase